MKNQNTPPNTPTTGKRKNFRGIGKIAVVAGLGIGLLIPGGALAGFAESVEVPAAQIRSENFDIGETALNVESAVWKITGEGNNERVLSTEELADVVIKPGELLSFDAVTKPTVRDGVYAEVNFEGLEEVAGTILDDPAFHVSIENGYGSGSLSSFLEGGSSYANLLSSDDNGDTVEMSIRISMEPISSPIYDDLSVGRGKTLDASMLTLAIRQTS